MAISVQARSPLVSGADSRALVFSEPLVTRGLTGTGVEVGVWRGDVACALLSRRPGRLVLVDPWRHLEHGYTDIANVSQEEHEANYRATLRREFENWQPMNPRLRKS